MSVPAYYPYRSAAVRDSVLAFYDTLRAKVWPFASEERTVPTSYGQTFVRITGPAGAPPLVLLHGAAATSLMWAPNVQALSEAFRTFAVDQIGETGRSTCTRPPRSLSDLLSWLNELFDALQLGDGINLAGMSYGGALAAQYALHFPTRLNKAILLAPGNTVLRMRAEAIVRLALCVIASKSCVPRLVRWMFADMGRKDPQWIDAIIEELRIAMRSLQSRKVVIPPVLTDAEWAGLAVPTLFLVGDHETIYSAEKALRRLQRVAPQVRAEIIPGAGHDLTFAQAGIVNRTMLEFLRREPAVSIPAAPGGGRSQLLM